MKIVFLTSGLEPGRDGVGDYTTLLAAECARKGHRCALLALCDPFAADGPPQPAKEVPLAEDSPVLRLGAAAPWPVRVAVARRFIDRFAPDVISVQCVVYGFHPRGLPWRLPHRLAALCAGRTVHMMFHELWIGAEMGAPMSRQLVGAVQRRILLETVRRLRPACVHTSNGAYLTLLARHGVRATRLPLFSAVPPPATAGSTARIPGLWRFALFGALPPEWPPEPLLGLLRRLPGKKILTHAGHPGAGERLWDRLSSNPHEGIEWRRLGQLSHAQLTRFFAESDFGIATTPWDLIGKSSSTATMLEHGLPVVVNRDEVHYNGWREPGWSPLLIRMEANLPEVLTAARRGVPHWSLPKVASQFVQEVAAGQLP